jgi:Ca2+-binding EF-hand superfamily protein
MQFAFKVYDVDGDGMIGNDDLFSIIQEMVGQSLKEYQISEIVLQTFEDADAGA